MVRHIVMWKLKDGYSDHEKAVLLRAMKEAVENLKNQIPNVIDIKMHTCPIKDSSNADILLESSFENAAGLESYAKHPIHVDVAERMIVPYVSERLSFDFEA